MLFSKEQQEFIYENALGLRNEELTKRLNERFNCNFKVSQVKKFKNSHHISSGLKSCNLPVGSERISKGYVLVKIAEPNIWKEKHRVIYESTYSNIPTGHKLMFLDGNKKNCNISNLKLVKNSEEAYINKLGYSGISREFTEVAINLAKLMSKVNEVEK